MRFSSLVLKNLARRPFRTGLAMLAFSTAIAAVVSLLSVAQGFTQAFSDVYRSHAVDIVVSRQGSADRLSSSVDEAFATKLKSLPEIEKTAGVLLETMSLEDQEVYGIPTMGIRDDSWLREDYQWVGKRSASSNSSRDPRTIALGINLAQRLNVSFGESVNLFEEPYQVTGIFKSQSAWENGSMILPLSQLQSLTDRKGQVTYINVILSKNSVSGNAESTIKKIEELDSRLLAMTTRQFVETDTRMQLAGAMAWMTSVIALVMGAIGTLNTMMTSVMERTHEIGILRALGWRRGRITRMIVSESMVMAVGSIIVGVLMAIGLTWLLSLSPTTGGVLTPIIDSFVLAKGAVLGLLVGLLGSILPAIRASRMLPVEAFRPW